MNRNIISLLLVLSIIYACDEKTQNDSKNKYIVNVNGVDQYGLELQKLNATISKNPDDVNALVKRGNLSLNHYEFSNAFADAARAFRLDSNNFEARLLYASSLLNSPSRKEMDKIIAQRHFEGLLEQKPKHLKAMIGLANTYALLQDFTNALKWIDEAFLVNPKFIDAHILKGSIYKVRHNALLGNPEFQKMADALLDSAIFTYSYITQIDPQHHVTYMHLGLLFQQKADSICLDHYLSAVQIQPENLEYKYALAFAYGEFGQEREAIRIYEEMIGKDENYFEAYCQMGQILQFKYQQLDSAITYYSKVIKKDPFHLDAFVNLGIAYQDKGDITNALKNYAKAISIEPEERNPLVSIEQFDAQQKMAREGAEELRKRL